MTKKQYNTTVLVGTQWGDEGKGKVVDILSRNADMVVRSQGGNNAGHTVVVGGVVYKLHLLPSGILYKGTDCVIAAGVVVDPKSLLQELDQTVEKLPNIGNLYIDSRCHVVMPYHLLLDGVIENAKGTQAIGTTKKGIGPCYADKINRIGIRMGDLVNKDVFKNKLKSNLDMAVKILNKIYKLKSTLDFDLIYMQYCNYATKLSQYITDTTSIIYDACKKGKKVLFEGAQGTLLDISFGSYPFVTSSHPTTAGAVVGSGIGPTMIANCLGVTKAYTTRVGNGAFPTELNCDVGKHLQTIGQEVGTTTGRARRCGWLDTVILRYSVKINGLNCIALNKLDTLSGLPKLKICTSYLLDGVEISDLPIEESSLSKCEPVYIELDGWQTDLSQIRHYDDLPKNAKLYIEKIEQLIDCQVTMIGVGGNREQNIYKELS